MHTCREESREQFDEIGTSVWSYGVVVSISGCDPLDPGSTPGTAKFFNFYIDSEVV